MAQVPPTDTAMQLLNTDFESEEQSECLPMDGIKQFKTHFERWQQTVGSGSAGALPSTSDLARIVKEEQVHGLTRIYLHTLILGKRMTLNYSRYASTVVTYQSSS